jgi:hypothetical protein
MPNTPPLSRLRQHIADATISSEPFSSHCQIDEFSQVRLIAALPQLRPLFAELAAFTPAGLSIAG